MRLRFLLAVLGSIVALGIAFETTAQEPGGPALDPATFVTQLYIHGLPYAEARRFPPSAVPTLIAMLDEPANAPYFSNIVQTVGIIGDGSGTSPLIAFLERPGAVSQPEFQGRLATLLALGHLARQGDDAALAYLDAGCSPSEWAERGVSFTFGQYAGDSLNVLLAKMSVNGLAGSGRGRQRLVQLRDAPESADVAEALKYNVLEGLQFDARVRTEGERALGLEDR